MPKPPRLLIIAGSDSSGGAGIQADIKTACAFGVYAMTAVTAVTAQDTTGIHSVQPIPAALVREQITCCLADIGADAIKIGMLGSAEIANALADVLERDARGIPVVLDPVLASTSGTKFLDERGIAVLRERLFPIATLVTPNVPEFENFMTVSRDQLHGSEHRDWLAAFCGAAVLVKGGHKDGDEVVDTLWTRDAVSTYSYPRLQTTHTHGTGCTLATAIACGLAEGLSLPHAVGRAREFVQAAIATAPGFGCGRGPLNHLQRPARISQ
jgi:hydroxymethylpyrimidine/phosphomethylpyrimidine kinase